MKYTTNEILAKYSAPNYATRNGITEEFANKMAVEKENLKNLEMLQETEPSKIASAFNEVAEKEGARIMYRSANSLAVLVSEALRSQKVLCA